MLRRYFDFFLFSSFYIAGCAVIMAYQTNQLLHLEYEQNKYFGFVFFSTLCSYNFHWWLTPRSQTEMIRSRWTHAHKPLHLVLFLAGLLTAAGLSIFFIKHWFWLAGAALLTFLYSAPKLPLYPFGLLRKVAIGKTIYLAFVWMYVTTFLPVIFSEHGWRVSDILFCLSRFFLIYSICIIFDYRDRENDKKERIRSMITYFNDKQIDNLFYLSLLLFAASTTALFYTGFHLSTVLLLMIPGAITLALYKTSKRRSSDYFYYFVLDGLMMISAIFTSFTSI